MGKLPPVVSYVQFCRTTHHFHCPQAIFHGMYVPPKEKPRTGESTNCLSDLVGTSKIEISLHHVGHALHLCQKISPTSWLPAIYAYNLFSMFTRPGIAQFVALILVLLPAFAAGAPPELYACALLMFVGLLLLLFRPVTALPRSITYAACALILGSLLAFLPVDWFGRDEWRTTLGSYENVPLAAMVTPQPWHTLQGVGMILAGLAFGLFLLCQSVNGKNHEKLAGAFTLGVGAYAGFAIFAAITNWRHPWDAIGTFGFLPNRNHVGTLLVMGAVAGLGPFWSFLERRRWIQAAALGGAITLIVIATLDFCESRAAAGLLFAGGFLWLIGVFHRGIDRRVAISTLVLILFALGVFITSKAPSMQRLKQPAPAPAASLNAWDQHEKENFSEKSVSFDFRLLLYQDTCRMIADHPLTGIGLGNYPYLSQQYRDASLTQDLAIHSDNSWLLIAAEAGLPAAIAAMAIVILAFLRLRGCKRDPSWSVRWASATAVAIFVGHCALDVPAHRAATLLPALFLAGLAFRTSKARASQSTFSLHASRVYFAAAGGALFIAGAWLNGWTPLPKGKLPAAEIEKAPELIYALYTQHRIEEAILLTQSILCHTPLSSELYFQWGILSLTFEGTDKDVERLFATERLLEPHFTATSLRQAAAWLPVNRDQSLLLFADAMERARQQDRCTHTHCIERTFESIIQSTATLPELDDQLYSLTNNRPDMLLIWSQSSSSSTFQFILHKILARDPFLDHWSPEEQYKLLRIWWQKADRIELQQLLREHPSLENAAWPILAGDLARNLQYEQAWRYAETRLQLENPELLVFQTEGTSWQLREAYEKHKTIIAAERLAKSLFKEEKFEEILKFTREIQNSSIQSPFLSRLASITAARLSRWPEAWTHLVAMAHAKYPELNLQ